VITKVIVPDVGATGGEVRLVAWLAREGERVTAGQPLFTVETDKALQDIEAFAGGYLRRVLAPVDAVVAPGTVVALLADAVDEPLDADEPSRPPRRQRHDRGPVPPRVPAAAAAPPRLPAVHEPPAEPATDDLSPARLLEMYRRMVLIRRYEDHLYRLFLQGLVPGTLHQCQGQEAAAVGVCFALRQDDVIFSTHRPVGHLLAKGASLPALTAEIWGKATGCAGGKGGQMHLQDLSVGAPPSNAVVGANVPIATGAALGFRLRGLDRVAVSFFGDGAANVGAVHEGMNLAAVKAAPVVFVCENNLYAASTPLALASKVTDIAGRAAAYGIPGHTVDGMDVVAVHRSAAEAVARARAGGGPTLLEYKTYRYPGHSRGDPGNYRSKQEVEDWRRRDPIPHCRRLLAERFDQTVFDRIEEECQAEVEAAVRSAQDSPEPPAAAAAGPVFAPREAPLLPSPLGGEGSGVRGRSARRLTMAEALRDGLAVALRGDPTVFLLGEDLGVPGGFGGGFTVTLGLAEEFGHERVMDTPISEAAIVGAAVGAAMTGMRPVAEMQYGDFVFGAMDQVVNQAAKMHYMSDGRVSVPLVLRLPVGASQRGAQHGQSTEAYFLHTPGLKVVCPSNPYDAKGLLLAAIRDRNPVVFLEHKLLYGGKGGRKETASVDLTADVPADDYEVPLGTVAVRRPGSDLTILANMLMVHRTLEAADRLAREGIDAEVIDVRCLVPLDLETLRASAEKTGRVLIVEEDNLTGGWGAEVAARLGECAFGYLDAPITRLAAPDTPLPCAPTLERAYVPSVDHITAAARELLDA
jgi:pyruvate/2-oxoglutarate/acetoin dehydrogenase E1 component/TPP-dependent pyruvate/acetoin dehydrogenase alpha subunit